MKKYLKIYWMLTKYAIESSIATRWAMLIFIFGKLFRLGIFGLFVYFLFQGTSGVANYSKEQGFLFLAFFYLLSAMGQMFFRETYRFRPRLVSGEFDYDLVKPIHPLLKNLLGGFDLHDLVTLPVILFIFKYAFIQAGLTTAHAPLLILLLAISLLILFSLHVFVAGLMVINPDVDHGLMIYRDLELMGRFPVDVYNQFFQLLLTFVLPIGLAFTLPVKILLGFSSWWMVLLSGFISLIFLFIAFKFWNLAVKKYSSASS